MDGVCCVGDEGSVWGVDSSSVEEGWSGGDSWVDVFWGSEDMIVSLLLLRSSSSWSSWWCNGTHSHRFGMRNRILSVRVSFKETPLLLFTPIPPS